MNLERVYRSWERKVKAAAIAEGRAAAIAEGRVEGRAEGKAEVVLAVLDARGLNVTKAQRKRVLACTNEALLDAWVRAAVTTPSVSALLAMRQRKARAKSTQSSA